MLVVPSVYLGNIFYWQSILRAENVCVDEGEFFVKQTYRNRAEIATQGGVMPLTIPLEKGKNNKQPMHEVRISYAENWRALHFKTICSAYGRAAYFEHYKPELEQLFSQQPEYLCTFNTIWFNFFINEFELDHLSITHSKNYQEPNAQQPDLRPLMAGKIETGFIHQPYYHVFFDKYPQPENLSVLDLLLNEGPRGRQILDTRF